MAPSKDPPSKDPYREKELSTSPLGPMEPEILEEAQSKIWNRVTGGMSTKEFLLFLAALVLLYYLDSLSWACPAGISTC